MYKPGGTIASALGRIQQTNYVLPAIQREFVWKPEQIERLSERLNSDHPGLYERLFSRKDARGRHHDMREQKSYGRRQTNSARCSPKVIPFAPVSA